MKTRIWLVLVVAAGLLSGCVSYGPLSVPASSLGGLNPYLDPSTGRVGKYAVEEPVLLGPDVSGYAGVKSMVSGSLDGHYVGGNNGGRRGSHYYNPYTGNHYRNRKAGVPY